MATTAQMLELGPAAAEIVRLSGGVEEAHLEDPTPCGWPVSTLLDHLLGLAVAFRAGADRSGDVAGDGPDPDGRRLDPDWRAQLALRLEELVSAWRSPAAWEATTTVGGVTMPAAAMGRAVLDELVLHGWDLARATGQGFRCRPEDIEVVLASTRASAEPGGEAAREDLFGPVVEVAATAPPLHRALGYAGRDPHWHRGELRQEHSCARSPTEPARRS